MTIKYIAEDGTEFDTQYECEKYEHSLEHSKIFGLTNSFDVIQYHDPFFFPRITYLLCADDDAVESLVHRANVEGINVDGIDGPGYFHWDSESDSWTSTDEELAYLQSEAATLKVALRRLKEVSSGQ